MERYDRHIRLAEIGSQGQQRLSAAKVMVIGAGGLGCPVLQYLAAAGIGTLGIMDDDVVSISNLQRQILFGTSDLRKSKAMSAKKRLFDLNPEIRINAYNEKLSPKNALERLESYDIIVDGTDNFEARYWINDACILLNKPFVYGAIYKFEGQVAVFNHQKGPSYRCLFPSPPEQASIPNCEEVGVLGVLPGIIGTFQANEVLKIILKIGSPLSGKLLCYNTLTHEQRLIGLSRNEQSIEQVKARNALLETEAAWNCYPLPTLKFKDAIKKENVQFIDLRESKEQPKLHLKPLLCIPFLELELRMNELSKSAHHVFFCQSGKRSKKAVRLMQERKIKNCFSLIEGAPEIFRLLMQKKTI